MFSSMTKRFLTQTLYSERFSDQTLTSDAVMEMISKATMYPGNPEQKFINFCREEE